MKYVKQVIILVFLWTACLNIEYVEAIIGGFEAGVGQFKYQISLQVKKEHICGGVIITEQHVLSAAHCVIDEDTDEFRNDDYVVVVGVNDVFEKSYRRLEIEVEIIYMPREFKMVNDDPTDTIIRDSGDIIVLKLKKSLRSYSGAVWSKVKLPQMSKNYPDYENSKGILSGFGAYRLESCQNADGITVNEICEECKILKFAKSEVISNRACAALVTAMIYGKHLCARMDQHDWNIPEGACSGDSGSPLVLPDNTLIGILSGIVPDCNEQHHPSIYTRITSYLPFILTAVKDQASIDIRVAAYTYKIQRDGQVLKVFTEITQK